MVEKEEEEGKKSRNSSWTVATNWIVADGSLQNTVSFESPVCPVEEDEQTASRSTVALVLKPPPSDASPCEINVSFNEKHEVRQVYVCSTSRVYEIYYALEQQRDSEYLCTVRCGVAARDDGILQTGDTGEATAENHAAFRKTPRVPNLAAKSDSINSSSTDEDGWVEVRVSESALHNDTTKPMGEIINQNSGMKVQDYYEATAQITDSYPCVSLRLRLLSLQVKGCVFVEEIYVFAEPVESTDVGQSLALAESSAGNNLLAMLVPSLLQISKSGISRVQHRQDWHISEIREGQKLPGSESKATASTSNSGRRTVNQETPVNVVDLGEGKVQEPAEHKTEHGHLEAIAHSANSANVPNYNEGKIQHVGNLEIMLGQLDSRMARLEAFCARFEENMLKPLHCMTARMERLEQQLDGLTLRSHSPPKSYPFARIAAPEFSRDESESDSLYSHNDDENLDSASESEKNGSIGKPSPSNVDAAVAAIPPDLVPELVVTASEFSNVDGESDSNCDGSSDSVCKDTFLDKPSLSIDSALASALASFVSSTSPQPTKLRPSSMVKAPEFSNEDDKNDDKDSPYTGIHGNKGTESIRNSDSILCSSSSEDREVLQPKESWMEANAKGVLKWNHFYTGEAQSNTNIVAGKLNGTEQINDAGIEQRTNGVMLPDQPCGESLEGYITDSSFSETADKNQINAECANTTDSNEITSPNQFYSDDSGTEAPMNGDIVQSCEEESGQTGGNPACTAEADTIGADPARNSELQNAGCSMDRLDNELKQTSHPVLDFELPILDVKFVSEEKWCSELPLETLLGHVAEMGMQQSGLEDDRRDKVAHDQKDHLEFGERDHKEGVTGYEPFLDFEDLTVEGVSPCRRVEELKEPLSCGLQEQPFSSLI